MINHITGMLSTSILLSITVGNMTASHSWLSSEIVEINILYTFLITSFNVRKYL